MDDEVNGRGDTSTAEVQAAAPSDRMWVSAYMASILLGSASGRRTSAATSSNVVLPSCSQYEVKGGAFGCGAWITKSLERKKRSKNIDLTSTSASHLHLCGAAARSQFDAAVSSAPSTRGPTSDLQALPVIAPLWRITWDLYVGVHPH